MNKWEVTAIIVGSRILISGGEEGRRTPGTIVLELGIIITSTFSVAPECQECVDLGKSNPIDLVGVSPQALPI